MKKIFTLLIVAIFLISIMPVALADSENGTEVEDLDDNSSLEDATDEEDESEDELEDEEELPKKKGKPFLKAKAEIKKAKEHYLQAKEAFKLKKEEIREWRAKLKECKEEGNCDEVHKEHKKNAIQYLNRLSEHVLKALENVESRVDGSDMEHEEALMERIAWGKEKVSEIQLDIEALGEEPSKGEVKEIAKELRDVLKSVTPRLKLAAGMTVHAKLGEVVTKSENLVDKLGNQIDSIEGDTSEMDDLLSNFESRVLEAREHHTLSIESFKAGMDSSDHEEKLNKIAEAKEHQKYTKEFLKEAREYLKELVPMIKDANKVSDDSEEE